MIIVNINNTSNVVLYTIQSTWKIKFNLQNSFFLCIFVGLAIWEHKYVINLLPNYRNKNIDLTQPHGEKNYLKENH